MGGHHRQKYKKLKWNSENRTYRTYIEQIQATMTINEFLRFHTNSFKIIMEIAVKLEAT